MRRISVSNKYQTQVFNSTPSLLQGKCHSSISDLYFGICILILQSIPNKLIYKQFFGNIFFRVLHRKLIISFINVLDIHVELSVYLSNESFIGTFRRFTSLRGLYVIACSMTMAQMINRRVYLINV